MKPRTTDVDTIYEGASGQPEDRVSALHPKLAIMADPNALPKEDGRGMAGYPRGSEEPASFYTENSADAKNDGMPDEAETGPNSEQAEEKYDR